MEELRELEELFEEGFIDEAQYERRRKQILNQSGAFAEPAPVSDGDKCDACGDLFDEVAPPWCANCGAKTKYHEKTKPRASEDPLPKRSTNVATTRDGFEDDMLEALLSDLAMDPRGTAGSGGAGGANVQTRSMPRDTFAVRGDERFSERDLESSREAKAAAKKKVVAQGARPAMGGDTWEEMQQQIKRKNTNTQIQQQPKPQAAQPKPQVAQPALPRDTFAAAGDERFSERPLGKQRETVRPAQQQQKPQPQPQKQQPPQQQPKAAPNAGRVVTAPAAAAKQQAPPAQNLPRDTFAQPGTERFSDRVLERPKRTSLRQHGEPPEVEVQRAEVLTRPAELTEDLDAELAMLDAELGLNMGSTRASAQPADAPRGRVYSEIVPAKPIANPHSKRKPTVTEKAQGGPELPAGMQWVQTPMKSAPSSRSTFAHQGDERFSNRIDPSLPKGVLTESPMRLCGFCQKEIGKGQKFKTALGQVWHQECFKCSICAQTFPTGTTVFRGDGDFPVCADCKAKRRNACPLCGQLLAKQEAVNVTGLKIHTKCFRCNVCDASLLGGYVQKKGQFLCLAHRDAEPVARNWADPNDRGPGTAPAKHPVKTGPSDAERQRAEERKRRQLELEREEADELRRMEEQRVARLKAEEEHRQRSLSYYRQSKQSTPNDSELGQKSVVMRDAYAANDAWEEELLRDLMEDDEPQAPPPPPDAGGSDDEDTEPGDSRMSGERMMDEQDKPDWMKQRDAEERGSFRSNSRKAQEDLNRKQGAAAPTYYEMDDDEDEHDVKVQMQFKQTSSATRRK